jgi:hypothetical protein
MPGRGIRSRHLQWSSLGKPAAIIVAGSSVLTWSLGGVISLVAEPAALDLAIALAFGQAKINRARNPSPAGKVRDCAHRSSSGFSSTRRQVPNSFLLTSELPARFRRHICVLTVYGIRPAAESCDGTESGRLDDARYPAYTSRVQVFRN